MLALVGCSDQTGVDGITWRRRGIILGELATSVDREVDLSAHFDSVVHLPGRATRSARAVARPRVLFGNPEVLRYEGCACDTIAVDRQNHITGVLVRRADLAGDLERAGFRIEAPQASVEVHHEDLALPAERAVEGRSVSGGQQFLRLPGVRIPADYPDRPGGKVPLDTVGDAVERSEPGGLLSRRMGVWFEFARKSVEPSEVRDVHPFAVGVLEVPDAAHGRVLPIIGETLPGNRL